MPDKATNKVRDTTTDAADRSYTVSPMSYTQDEIRRNATPSYTQDEICRFAKKDELPDGGLNLIEHLLWYKLRDIYNEHRLGLITPSQGAERKQDAINWAMSEWERKSRDDEQVYRCAHLWQGVEDAADNYRKNRTIENADLLIAAIYGIGLNAPAATEVKSNG